MFLLVKRGAELFASAVPFLYQLFRAENKEVFSEAVISALEVEDYSGIISLLAKEGYTKKEAEAADGLKGFDYCGQTADFFFYLAAILRASVRQGFYYL